jgi:PAS domain S-box-containing protein
MGLVVTLSRAPAVAGMGWVLAGAAVMALSGGTVLDWPGGAAASGWLLFSGLLVYLLLDRVRPGEDGAVAEARTAMLEAEACLDVIISSLPDALVVADDRGCIRLFNPAAERLFGYPPAAVMGEPFDGLFAEPYARQQRQKFKDHVAGDPDTGFVGSGRELMARRRDGALFPAEFSVAEMVRDGETRFVAVLHDLSARKRALARLDVAEKVLECTQEGVMVTDRRGTILWVNQAFCNISGYTRDEVLGEDASIMKSGLQDAQFYAAMWQAIRENGEWAGEIWNRRKDGEAYPEWLTIRPITEASGQTTRYVGVFSDISKHKRAEETIRTLTYYDAVTRLPNRYLFMDRL